jgi:hypothetical protein
MDKDAQADRRGTIYIRRCGTQGGKTLVQDIEQLRGNLRLDVGIRSNLRRRLLRRLKRTFEVGEIKRDCHAEKIKNKKNNAITTVNLKLPVR